MISAVSLTINHFDNKSSSHIIAKKQLYAGEEMKQIGLVVAGADPGMCNRGGGGRAKVHSCDGTY